VIAVVDTSAAVRVAMQAEESAQWARTIASADLVRAPQLLIAEAANAFWKYFRAGILSRASAERGLRSAVGLVQEFAPLEPLYAEVFELAVLTQGPAYDLFYVVLARRNGAVLVTADEALRERARRLGIRTDDAD